MDTAEEGRIAVDFVVRADSRRKRGGDDVQVEQYAMALERLGVDTRIVSFDPSMRLRAGAVTHVVNIDRPFEFLESCQRATGRLVISPIHHDPQGVRAMRENERGRGLRSFVDRVVPAVPRELLVACLRAARGTSKATVSDVAKYIGRSIARSVDLNARLAEALHRAHSVALLAAGEGRVLAATTGWDAANAVLIPNGMPDTGGVHPVPWLDRSRAMAVVGRIEPRKRQLEVVRYARSRGLDLTVVGELQNPTSAFGREFLQAVEAAPTVRYVGRLSRDETLAVMADTRVLINASWVEVQSLVDIEATAMGCFVAATPAGHSSEWLGDAVRTTTDIRDVRGLIDLATALAESRSAPPAVSYDNTWEHAAARLLERYDTAMLVT